MAIDVTPKTRKRRYTYILMLCIGLLVTKGMKENDYLEKNDSFMSIVETVLFFNLLFNRSNGFRDLIPYKFVFFLEDMKRDHIISKN